jgi:hypothetical protein
MPKPGSELQENIVPSGQPDEMVLFSETPVRKEIPSKAI